MSTDFLEISRFSQSGEKLRTIRCVSGRVTVFRARSEDELQTYRLAIEGKQPEQEFTLSIDEKPFNPKEHFFIGFGARDESPPNKSVHDYLLSWNVPAENIQAALSKMLLEGLATKRCSELSPSEWRMIRQVACFENPTDRKVFFLNDPFLEFTPSSLDLFADSWIKLAWKQKKIVIVTRLSERPECWLENDFIARIQLEKSRQATIGFGGGETSGPSAYEIKKIRAAMAETGSLTEVKKTSLLSTIIQTPKYAAIATFVAAIVIGSLLFLGRIFSQREDMIAISQTQQKLVEQTNNNYSTGSNNTEPGKKKSDSSLTTKTDQTDISRGFPEDIQLAWDTAVEHPDNLLISVKGSVSQNSSEDGATEGGSKFSAFYNFLQN